MLNAPNCFGIETPSNMTNFWRIVFPPSIFVYSLFVVIPMFVKAENIVIFIYSLRKNLKGRLRFNDIFSVTNIFSYDFPCLVHNTENFIELYSSLEYN